LAGITLIACALLLAALYIAILLVIGVIAAIADIAGKH
jgi:hypothetical protein